MNSGFTLLKEIFLIFSAMNLFSINLLAKSVRSFQCIGSDNVTFHQGHCYLIGQKKLTFQQAYSYCQILDGVLTDVTDDFINFNETKLSTDYWVGALWPTSLKRWTWASGSKHQPSVTEGWINVHHCASYNVEGKTNLQSQSCSSQFQPICKFESANGNSDCSQICEKIPGSDTDFMKNLTQDDKNLTNQGIEANISTEANDRVCAVNQDEKHHTLWFQVSIILGCLLTATLMANAVILLLILCKYKKASRLNKLDKKNRISLIDILKVGADDTRSSVLNENQSQNVVPTQTGSKCLIVDGESQDYTDINDSDVTRELKENSHTLHEPLGVASFEETQGELMVHYSTLNCDHLSKQDLSHVYGLESASVHLPSDGIIQDDRVTELDRCGETVNMYSNTGAEDQ